ncbi:hypothetical protein G7046_g2271 [Stylonectria norvegica]|nr:hypothetical protein G7046_g2271 [Stylonectria norvegica]
METINNVVTAASKAVWGENKEPVSGAQGDTSKGEPYDAGNLATPLQERVEGDLTDRTKTSSSFVNTDSPVTADTNTPSYSQQTTTSNYVSNTDAANSSSDFNRTERDTQDTRTPVIADANTPDVTSKSTTFGSSTNNNAPTSGDNYSRDTSTTNTDYKPAATDPTAGQSDRKPPTTDTTAGQNDTRDPDVVQPTSQKQDIVTKESGPADEEGAELKGPGPKPLEELASERGGDVGHPKKSQSSPEDPLAEGSKDASEHHGTGEIYVKTSGFAADGGDFDATKPGAGREADRLLDEKHHETGAPVPSGSRSHDKHDSSKHDSKPDSKDKPSLGERIKAKLHKH